MSTLTVIMDYWNNVGCNQYEPISAVLHLHVVRDWPIKR